MATLHKGWASLDMDKNPGVLLAVHPFWTSSPGRRGGGVLTAPRSHSTSPGQALVKPHIISFCFHFLTGIIFVGCEQEILHPWAGVSPREPTRPELSESLLAHFSLGTGKVLNECWLSATQRYLRGTGALLVLCPHELQPCYSHDRR